jgi:DNA-entry nuclease
VSEVKIIGENCRMKINMELKKFLLSFVLACMPVLCGCNSVTGGIGEGVRDLAWETDTEAAYTEATYTEATYTEATYTEATYTEAAYTSELNTENNVEADSNKETFDDNAGSSEDTGVSLADIPEYSGDAYVVLEDNQPDFSDSDKQLTDSFEYYSELDSLGRCGQAYANICKELQPSEARGEIGQVKPSGWHTVKYNDLIDGNYLYNRCHLIGYQLAGENANEKNLITGTRYLNVVGMLPFEDKVDDYVDSTGNHVLYRVTPIFEGANLVASGVQMEAWSVEDNGKGICFNVYCYNVQPGIAIDYATGDSWENSADIVTTTENILLDNNATEAQDFILNTNTKKIHIPDCSSVDSMADHNKEAYTGTVEELKEKGYSPCQKCLSGY